MGLMKRKKVWFFILLLTGITLTGCNGGNVNVGYAPVSACSSIDYDPMQCR